jgi:glycosyltransferase involved in cell wall biosynthesis
MLFQGGFSPNRNLEKLVAIASHIRNGVLVMLGWGDLEKKLKQKAEKLGILDRKLFFVPKLGQDDLISYTGSASLGLIPYPPVDINTIYCTPNKLFEFISAQVPILANQGLVTVGDFLSRYHIGTTVDFTDERLAARAIDEIVADAVRTNDLRHNLKVARDELNWSQEDKKLIRMMQVTIKDKMKAAGIKREPSERGSICVE